MKIDWNLFSPSEFETLCAAILEENGFYNIQWHGGSGSDRGRDITALRQISHFSSSMEVSKWVVQCKRYTSKRPTKAEIHDWLVSCNEHNPSYCLVIISNSVSSQKKDWFEAEKNQFQFKIFLWEEIDLIREIVKHKKALSLKFPQLYSTGFAVKFYVVDQPGFFYCDEFNDVGFCVYHFSNSENAKAQLVEFIQFLKANDPYVE